MFNRITGSLDDVRLNDIQNNKAKDFASYADTYGFDEALVMYPNLLVTVRDTLDTSIIPFEGNFFQTKDGKNRVDGLADTLLTESSVNEYLALKPVYSSSLYITEGLDRSKSGIPTEWSARNRDIVSFVFNHNRNNLTTSIFETQSGNVVMNIKQENESSFIEIDEVREEIYNILVKEEKEAYAIKIINDLLDNNDTLDNINDNSFISIYKDIEGKVSSNLTVSTEYNSGINYEIMGCINSMNSGDISYIINTKNNDSENDLLYVIELKNKTIVTTDSLIASNQTTSKNNLYNRRKNGSIYNSWLVYNRDNQEVKLDMRHKIY